MTCRIMNVIRLSELLGPAWHGVARDVFEHGHTHYNFSGGRGSLKSSTVSLLVPLLLARHPDAHALVLRKVGNTLRDSVYTQYVWAVGELGMAEYWTAKVSPLELIYKPTGQRILFRGADDPMKIKSIKAPFGYIAVTHFEELDQFDGREEIRNILQSTMRGGPVFWNFETYNPPITRDSWVNRDATDPKLRRSDRLRHHSTYLDAPREWLGEPFIAEAEHVRDTDARAYRHEYLGEATGAGGEVFDNLEIRQISDGEIARFDRIMMGIDWGWYPDPFHWAKVHWDPARRTLYLIDEYRANKQSNEQTWAALKAQKGVRDFDLITADSAEEKSIQDYRAYGSMCRGAVKGPDSRRYSFKWLQGLKAIVIDPERCPHAAEEFRRYAYARTKDGEILNSYPDGNDHAIDAVRYATEGIWRRKGQ